MCFVNVEGSVSMSIGTAAIFALPWRIYNVYSSEIMNAMTSFIAANGAITGSKPMPCSYESTYGTVSFVAHDSVYDLFGFTYSYIGV
jgi:hypothetical protein